MNVERMLRSVRFSRPRPELRDRVLRAAVRSWPMDLVSSFTLAGLVFAVVIVAASGPQASAGGKRSPQGAVAPAPARPAVSPAVLAPQPVERLRRRELRPELVGVQR